MLEQKQDKTRARLRKARKELRRLKEKGIVAPPVDKMVKEPEKGKEVWELLAIRERDIHSGH